jgi:hypothetical protein
MYVPACADSLCVVLKFTELDGATKFDRVALTDWIERQ